MKRADAHPARYAKPRKHVYAGMEVSDVGGPLQQLRSLYQSVPQPDYWRNQAVAAASSGALQEARRLVASARAAAAGLSLDEREEVELLDAKIDLRLTSDYPGVQRKLKQYLRKAKVARFAGEARGWLAHTYYKMGERTRAGKMYLDELDRPDAPLSQNVLLTSLRMTYEWDGGEMLRRDLAQYFDTPEHAAFAVQMVTNARYFPQPGSTPAPIPYAQIQELLRKNERLLRTSRGAKALAVLAMRTSLRAGDPAGVLRAAVNVPIRESAVREDPDFLWMLGSAQFLTKDYAGADKSLAQLFESRRASNIQRASAAYGLLGVHYRTGDRLTQLRYAMWLHTAHAAETDSGVLSECRRGLPVYWDSSRFDIAMLLDAEASIETLQTYVEQHAGDKDIGLVRYSLAVRLAREDRYEEAAAMYRLAGASLRAGRMSRAASFYGVAGNEGRVRFAAYLADNSERIFFNDRLWNYSQRYAMGETVGLGTEESARQSKLERDLKDSQEELWRAYLILREVVREEGPTMLGKRAAGLAVRCLRRLSGRFGPRERDCGGGYRTFEMAEAKSPINLISLD